MTDTSAQAAALVDQLDRRIPEDTAPDEWVRSIPVGLLRSIRSALRSHAEPGIGREKVARLFYEQKPFFESGEYVDHMLVSPGRYLSWEEATDRDEGSGFLSVRAEAFAFADAVLVLLSTLQPRPMTAAEETIQAGTDTPQPADDGLVGRIKRAQAMVSDLCQGKRRWVMPVPANPDHDPDLVIADGLSAGMRAIQRAEAAERRVGEERAKAFEEAAVIVDRIAAPLLKASARGHLSEDGLGDLGKLLMVARSIRASALVSEAEHGR